MDPEKHKSPLPAILTQMKQAHDRLGKASLENLNKLLDNFIMWNTTGKDFSPLLTVYDELSAKSNFKLPVKSILEQD